MSRTSWPCMKMPMPVRTNDVGHRAPWDALCGWDGCESIAPARASVCEETLALAQSSGVGVGDKGEPEACRGARAAETMSRFVGCFRAAWREDAFSAHGDQFAYAIIGFGHVWPVRSEKQQASGMVRRRWATRGMRARAKPCLDAAACRQGLVPRRQRRALWLTLIEPVMGPRAQALTKGSGASGVIELSGIQLVRPLLFQAPSPRALWGEHGSASMARRRVSAQRERGRHRAQWQRIGGGGMGQTDGPKPLSTPRERCACAIVLAFGRGGGLAMAARGSGWWGTRPVRSL